MIFSENRYTLFRIMRLMPGHAPADHSGLDRASGLVIVPPAVDKVAGKRQLIGSAMVLAQDLDRQARWWNAGAIEFGQSSFACCHLIYSPKYAARPRRIEKTHPVSYRPAAGANHSAGIRYQCDIARLPCRLNLV